LGVACTSAQAPSLASTLAPVTVPTERVAVVTAAPTQTPTPVVVVVTATPTPTKPSASNSNRKVGGEVGHLAPEFGGINAWINGGPYTMEDLRGQVVLIDFWTYTCINCVRTYPFLKQWHLRYANDGLVIVATIL